MCLNSNQFVIFLLIFCNLSIDCNKSFGLNINAFNYLKKYGFISEDKPIEDMTNNGFKESLIELQEFAGIERTGKVNQNTQELMNSRRCGHPDIRTQLLNKKKRTKRFVLSGQKWLPAKEGEEIVLSYKIEPQTQASAHQKEFSEAIRQWESVCNVHFKSEPKATFVALVFNFNQTIDGKGGQLYKMVVKTYVIENKPLVGIVFELEDENWSPLNLTNALLHLFGHALGLDHSSDPNSIMYPFFDFKRNVSTDKLILSADDRAAAQTLYGLNPKNPDLNSLNLSPNRADWSDKAIDLCLDSKVDSVLELPDGRWVFFKGQHYYEIGPVGQHLNSPRKIVWDFKEVKDSIDASLDWSEDMLFLFKGDKYWKYKNKTFISVHKVSDGFKGVPDGPFDDVFRWNVNQKTYFFKGDQYWKYDSQTKSVPNGYPKTVSKVWKGVPVPFDAAISSRKRNQTYFFKDDKYYRFDDISKKVVDDVTPPYPRMTQIWFLKCRNTLNLTEPPEREPSPHPTPPPVTKTAVPTSAQTDENSFWVVVLSVILGALILAIIGTGGYSAYLLYFAPPVVREEQPVQVITSRRTERQYRSERRTEARPRSLVLESTNKPERRIRPSSLPEPSGQPEIVTKHKSRSREAPELKVRHESATKHRSRSHEVPEPKGRHESATTRSHEALEPNGRHERPTKHKSPFRETPETNGKPKQSTKNTPGSDDVPVPSGKPAKKVRFSETPGPSGKSGKTEKDSKEQKISESRESLKKSKDKGPAKQPSTSSVRSDI